MSVNAIDLALCRSALYEALALGFRPPKRERIERLTAKQHNTALREIAAILQKGFTTDIGFSNMVAKLANPISLEALAERYRVYFGHTAHSSVPPYETEYGEETLFQQPQQLGDLAGFYNAFGLQLNDAEHERVDHVSCECEYMAFLTRKEAYAQEQEDVKMRAQTRRAQRLFLKDHLGRFIPAFTNLLMKTDGTGFYGALGRLCATFVETECARHNVPTGPEHLRLRPKVTVDDCFTCGGGAEIISDMCGENCDA